MNFGFGIKKKSLQIFNEAGASSLGSILKKLSKLPDKDLLKRIKEGLKSDHVVDQASAAGATLRATEQLGLEPQERRLLIDMIGAAKDFPSMAAAAQAASTIAKRSLPTEESSLLVDILCRGPDLMNNVHGAEIALRQASEFAISLADTERLTDVMRQGLGNKDGIIRDLTANHIVNVIRHNRMRGAHNEVIQSLARDLGAGYRIGAITDRYLDEDNRAFLQLVFALAKPPDDQALAQPAKLLSRALPEIGPAH